MVRTNTFEAKHYDYKHKVIYFMFLNCCRSVVDTVCLKEIECKPLYYYQLQNSKRKISKEVSKKIKNNLKDILTAIIKDSLINMYPLKTWKN